jgi:tRNA pseudouridine38-40 synthase
MRYLFSISYLGTHYNGWQTQANAKGVQEVVEDALSKILRTKISIVGSGRTDTGVHCSKQFFHADLPEQKDVPKLLQNLNAFLPKDIAIHSIQLIHPDASARYHATQRSYRYIITRKKDPLLVDLAWYFFKSLDVPTMNRAAALLLGTHDFECFSKVKTDVNHFVCTIKKARWQQKGDLLMFEISANRFLRGMVRAIVGTLIDVGSGKISMKDFESILKSKDRKKAGMNVPAEGLYLIDVKYPKTIFSLGPHATVNSQQQASE